MKKTIYLLMALWVTLVACDDKWNEHYSNDSSLNEIEGASPLNLYNYLKTISDYSEFVKMLDKAGLDKVLSVDEDKTVFALSNASVTTFKQSEEWTKLQLSAAADLKKKMDENGQSFTSPQDSIVKVDSVATSNFIRFYVTMLKFPKDRLKNNMSIPALNSKFLAITVSADLVKVMDVDLINLNQYCRNGVVHELTACVVPQSNLYDELKILSDDYSIIRDSIFAMEVRKFDRNNSRPIGFDPMNGSQIYDSVFISSNPIYLKANFNAENEYCAILIPTNKAIEDSWGRMVSYVTDTLEREMVMADTLRFYQWIRDVVFIKRETSKSKIDDFVRTYNPNQATFITTPASRDSKVYSSPSAHWLPKAQALAPVSDYITCSNGVLIPVTYLHYPKYQSIGRFKGYYNAYDQMATVPGYIAGERDVTFVTSSTASISGGQVANGYYGISLSSADAKTAWMAMPTMKMVTQPDGTLRAEPQFIPLGEYDLYMGAYTTATIKAKGWFGSTSKQTLAIKGTGRPLDTYDEAQLNRIGTGTDPIFGFSNADRSGGDCSAPTTDCNGAFWAKVVVNRPKDQGGRPMSGAMFVCVFKIAPGENAGNVALYHWTLKPVVSVANY